MDAGADRGDRAVVGQRERHEDMRRRWRRKRQLGAVETEGAEVAQRVLAALLHLLVSPPASNMLSRATYLATGLPDGRVDECEQERRRHEAPRD